MKYLRPHTTHILTHSINQSINQSINHQIKTTKDKGSDRCHAYCTVHHKCFPQECPLGQWEVVVVDQHVSMTAVTIHSEVGWSTSFVVVVVIIHTPS